MWGILRKAHDEDWDLLRERAWAFCKRHGIQVFDDPIEEIDLALCNERGNPPGPYRLNRLWARVVERALGPGAEGIAYGYVGYSVKN